MKKNKANTIGYNLFQIIGAAILVVILFIAACSLSKEKEETENTIYGKTYTVIIDK